jgi:hypothetical protein
VIVLSRGDRIARTLGLKRLRVGVFPFALGLPFGLVPLAPSVPIPTKIIVEVLDPVDWSGYPAEAAEDPDTVQSCYDEITSSMQAALDRLVDEMPHPRATRLLCATGLLDR